MSGLLGIKTRLDLRMLLNGLLREMAGENPVSFYNHGTQAKAARMYKEASRMAATDDPGTLSMHLAERSTEVELLSQNNDKRELLPRRVHTALKLSASNLNAALQDTTQSETQRLIEVSAPMALSHALPRDVREPAYIALGLLVKAQCPDVQPTAQTQTTSLLYTQEAAAHFASHISGYFSE